MNSQLIRMEATANGYVEGIALDTNGYVSEGSGENIFLVMDGTVVTPPLVEFRAARHHAPLRNHHLPRPRHPGRRADYSARNALHRDEVFFCGTAVEITPIRSIDRVKIGIGSRGPITKRIQDEFFALAEGKKPDRHNWLFPVGVTANATVVTR